MIHLPEVDWWGGAREALVEASSGVASERIAGIGLAGLFPAICLSAPEGHALSEGILYGDRRGVTATDAVVPRLMHLLRTIPEIALRDSIALGPAGYLGLRLTGVPSIDPYSATRWEPLLAATTGTWDRAAAAHLGVPPRMLPPIVAPGALLGTITAAAARDTGLPEGIPVVAPTTDSLATMLGSGVVRAGDALAYYGSTGTLLLVTTDLEQALADAHAPGAATPYRRVAHATGSGLFAELVRREWLGGVDHTTLNAEAAAVPAGSEGVMVVPYLSGRLLPTPEPGLRASVAGIGLGHGRGHLWRAMLEAFGWVLMSAQQDGHHGARDIRRVTAAGGGSRSAVWRGIVNDMTGWQQSVAPAHASVRGAAFLAAQALSGAAFSQLAQRWLEPPDGGEPGRATADTAAAPDPAVTEHYRTLLPRWTRLVAALAESLDGAP